MQKTHLDAGEHHRAVGVLQARRDALNDRLCVPNLSGLVLGQSVQDEYLSPPDWRTRPGQRQYPASCALFAPVLAAFVNTTPLHQLPRHLRSRALRSTDVGALEEPLVKLKITADAATE